MTTRQTPDAVREARRIAADVLALPPGLRSEYLDGKYDTGDHVRIALTALDSRAGDAGEEIENGYTADDAVDFVFNRLASKLGLVDWQVVEGSEEWEGDVSATLHRLLIDAGIIDDETGAVATLATPAPAVDAVPAGEVVERLKETAEDLRKIGWHKDRQNVLDAIASLSHGEGRK